jgi:penicillin-binding protein 2
MPTLDRSSLNITFRIWVALGLSFFCLFVLILRLWYLQIMKGEYFRDRSENNRLRTIYLPSPRGLIFDRNGELLVRNRPSFNVDLVVEDSPDPKKTIEALAEIVGEDSQELQDRLSKQTKRRRFEPKLLLRDISRDTVGRISAQRHRLPGIIVSVVPTREYVHGDLASHVVGYIREINQDQLKNQIYRGYRMGDDVGHYGIEATLERYLRGERGSQAVIVNAIGNKIGEAFFQPEIPGTNVTLTIDAKVQRTADKLLEGKKGAVVALDVRTGDVIAMSSGPRFDPNMFTSEISKEDWSDLTNSKEDKLSNRVLQGAYPPGSVFKIFVAAAALSEGVVTPTERMTCNGALQFGTRSFRCHKHSGHGSVDLFDSIVQSCDVYFYTIGQRLGVDRIYHYAHDIFGFGESTDLGLGEEVPGLIPSTKWKQAYFRNPEDKRWYPGETLPVAIGQGAVTTTPLQVARALAAVVNGGKLLKPRIVRQLVASDGRIIQQASDQPEVIGTLEIEPWVLDKVKQSMVGVVEDKRGTGHRAALPKERGISVGGKTGTAQVASRESGSKREDHAWFAGYAPADKPRIVVVAILENAGHGGAVAAPVVHDVMAAYFGVDDVGVATVVDEESVVED